MVKKCLWQHSVGSRKEDGKGFGRDSSSKSEGFGMRGHQRGGEFMTKFMKKEKSS